MFGHVHHALPRIVICLIVTLGGTTLAAQ